MSTVCNIDALATYPVGPGGPLADKAGPYLCPGSKSRWDSPFANETPQGFTRVESVVVARPGMSETRFV
jgi:hypothetical protein